jgi:hypothetical protein
MIDILAAIVGSAVVSAIVTRYYFPRIIQVEKIVDRVVDRIVDRVVEVPVEKIVEKIVYVDTPALPASSRPRLLSAEERREMIRAKATDPDILAQVTESVRRRDKAFGGIAPDSEAQINPNWGRKRKKK